MKFTIHTKKSSPEASQEALKATEKAYGYIPNLHGVLAESPTAIQAYAAISEALNQSALRPIEQQVIALTVSSQNNCSYCIGEHCTIAQRVRMPDPILTELREQRSLSDERLEVLRKFVLSIMKNHGWIIDNEAEMFLNSGFERRHILDVITIIALKTLSNYVNHIAETPLDEQFAAQKWSVKTSKFALSGS